MASETSAVAILNSLVLAIFLVGIGLLILLQLNISRRNNPKTDKGKPVVKSKKKPDEDDLVAQLPYMSREELREMILKERALRLAASAPGQDSCPPTVVAEVAEPVAGLQPAVPPAPASAPDASSPSSETQQAEPISAEMSLLSNLALAATVEGKEESSHRPKPPYHDKVERSMLSNEIPEEFRRKSRRI